MTASPLRRTLLRGRTLRYTLRRNKRTRRPGLEVCKRDGLVVSVPWRAREETIPELIHTYADWLVKKLDAYDCWDGPWVREYATGTELLVLGRPRRLKFKALAAGARGFRAELDLDHLTFHMAPERILDPAPVVEKYLRDLARDHLVTRTEYWAERVGKAPKRVIIGERTTRWGSCSPSSTISYCYRLIMAPPEAIDSIITHELCHLRHFDHSHRFWKLLDEVYPPHRLWREWLNEHEDELIV
jgi:predicted metal-dependent hydrolase